MCCWSSSWPCASSAAAVWEALWGSTPIITGMWAPFSRADRRHREGRPTLGRGRPLLSHSRSGAGGTAQPFLSQLKLSGSGVCGATCRHPGTLRLQTQGSYPNSISRRSVVEVAAAFGLPLLTGAAFAVATLAGPLDLGRGPLERGADLISLDLGDRPLVTLGGLPAPLAQSTGDHDPVALGEGVGQVLGLAAPDIDLEEAGVAVAPLIVLLDALGHGDPHVGDGDAGVGEAELGVLDQVADDGGVVVRCHALCAPSCCCLLLDGLAFGAGPLGPPTGAAELQAGVVDGVGGPVVLAGLPDERVGVVLAAVVDGHPHPEGEGGFAVADGLAAVGVVVVGGDAEVGVEPVEGLLGGEVGDGVAVGPVVEVELDGVGG